METVTEEPLGGNFIRATFREFSLTIDEKSCFVNATSLCSSKDRTTARYFHAIRREALKRKLETYYGDVVLQVRGVRQNRSLAGDYFHPALFLDLAAWLTTKIGKVEADDPTVYWSPKIYFYSAVIIDAFFHRTKEREEKLPNIFPSVTTAEFNDPYPIINGDVWFNPSAICTPAANQEVFEALKQSQCLQKYLWSKNLPEIGGLLYHPLLYLRLTAWIDGVAYAQCVHEVFCSDRDDLRPLFRIQIANAVADPLNNQLEFLQQQVQGLDIGNYAAETD